MASAGSAWALAADDDVDLHALETAALAADADAEAWWAYAAALAAAERDEHALQALDEVLERAPYHEDARRQRGLVLARAGAVEDLLAWMQELVFTHPAMADGMFKHGELAPYMDDQRFRELAAEARIQAVD